MRWMVCSTKCRLSGTVKDTDGTLYNVKVVIDGTGKGATTDDRLFSIKGVPSGSYTVTAKLFEYQDLSPK